MNIQCNVTILKLRNVIIYFKLKQVYSFFVFMGIIISTLKPIVIGEHDKRNYGVIWQN